MNDITEQHTLELRNRLIEEHLMEQQKLESIGLLAGGVAHEINNPINGIMNYAQLILDDSSQDFEYMDYTKEIIHETDRITEIV